jgi:hypothetical protein
MIRKRKKPTWEELEESAERDAREFAQRHRERVAAFFAASQKAIREALLAADSVLRANEPIEHAKTSVAFRTASGSRRRSSPSSPIRSKA